MAKISKESALALQEGLANLEKARTALEGASAETVEEAADAYEAARREVGPAFGRVRSEYSGETIAEADAEEEPAPPVEASPGVPLVAPPGVLITAQNLGNYGVLTTYRSTTEDPVTVLATPYAFAAGTAVKRTAEEDPVALSQPSRLILDAEAGAVGIVANDVFNDTYEEGEPAPTPPEGSGVPVGTEPAAETPSAPEGTGATEEVAK